MQTALRKMGNSTGMIVPKSLLTEIGLGAGAVLDVRIEDGRLVATPITPAVRSGWEDDAATLAAVGASDEEQVWRNFGNEADDTLAW
jgi:antitoxin MazE